MIEINVNELTKISGAGGGLGEALDGIGHVVEGATHVANAATGETLVKA